MLWLVLLAQCGSAQVWECGWKTHYSTYYTGLHVAEEKTSHEIARVASPVRTETAGVLEGGSAFLTLELACEDGVPACDDASCVSALGALSQCTSQCAERDLCTVAAFAKDTGCTMLTSCTKYAPDMSILHTPPPSTSNTSNASEDAVQPLLSFKHPKAVLDVYGLDRTWSTQNVVGSASSVVALPDLCYPRGGTAPSRAVHAASPEECGARCAEETFFCRYFTWGMRVAFEEVPPTPTATVTVTETLNTSHWAYNATVQNTTDVVDGILEEGPLRSRRFDQRDHLTCTLHAACDTQAPPVVVTEEDVGAEEPFLSEGRAVLYSRRRGSVTYMKANKDKFGGELRWEDAATICEAQGRRLCTAAEVCYAFLEGYAHYTPLAQSGDELRSSRSNFLKVGEFADLLAETVQNSSSIVRWVAVSDFAHEFVSFARADASQLGGTLAANFAESCTSRVQVRLGVGGGSLRLPPFSRFDPRRETSDDVLCCGAETCEVPGVSHAASFLAEGLNTTTVNVSSVADCSALCRAGERTNRRGFTPHEEEWRTPDPSAAPCTFYNYDVALQECTLVNEANFSRVQHTPPALPLQAAIASFTGAASCKVSALWGCEYIPHVALPNVTDTTKQIDFYVVLLRQYEETEPLDLFVAALREFLAAAVNNPSLFHIMDDRVDDIKKTVTVEFKLTTTNEETKQRAATLIRFQEQPFQKVRVLDLDVCYLGHECEPRKYFVAASGTLSILPVIIGPLCVAVVVAIIVVAWKIRPTTAGKVAGLWALNRIPRTAAGELCAVNNASPRFPEPAPLGANNHPSHIPPEEEEVHVDVEAPPKKHARVTGSTPMSSGLPPLHPPAGGAGPPQIEITPSPLTQTYSAHMERVPSTLDSRASCMSIPDAKPKEDIDNLNTTTVSCDNSENSGKGSRSSKNATASAADTPRGKGKEENQEEEPKKHTVHTSKTLFVVLVASNPTGCKEQTHAFKEFRRRVERASCVQVVVIECLFPGQAEYCFTEPNTKYEVQVRGAHRIWLRENLVNVAIEQALPSNWRYVCWVDGVQMFSDRDWAKKTLALLKKHPVVQLYEEAHFVIPSKHKPADNAAVQTTKSLAAVTEDAQASEEHYAAADCDFGWALSRKGYDMLAGIPQFGISGTNDRHLAFALVGKVQKSIPDSSHRYISEGYSTLLQQLEARAQSLVVHSGCEGTIPFVRGNIAIHNCGSIEERTSEAKYAAYSAEGVRGTLLFDPKLHLSRDAHGVVILTDRSFVANVKKLLQRNSKTRSHSRRHSGEKH